MKKVLFGGFALTVLLASQAPVQAQAPAPPGGFARPNYYPGYNQGANVLSPWLNLGLGTGNPAINFYNGVLPEMARRQDERRFGNAITDIDRRLVGNPETDDSFPVLSGTGHPTAFQNYGGYFNMGRGGNKPLGSSASPVRPPQQTR